MFQNTIQRIEGKEVFIQLCKRLTDRCKELKMELGIIFVKDNEIIFDSTMTKMFTKFPSTPIYGSTKLTLHPDGKIIRQRDHYDLLGDIFNGIPWFKKAIPAVFAQEVWLMWRQGSLIYLISKNLQVSGVLSFTIESLLR